MRASAPELEVGMEVTPSVRLLAPLRDGGMGAVWLAEHTGLKTRVVVKFILGDLLGNETARQRFSREAAAVAQVKSPHVVSVLDHGVTPEGLPFIVMEHLEGRDLAVTLKERGRLPPVAVVGIVAQIAKALAKVHTAGLVHRDVKPDNVFLIHGEGDDELFVKLLDFGIAKAEASGEDATLSSETKTGQVVGTPFYMSPEQVTAQRSLDARSDLWSLGVVAYEALTGRRPFDGPSFGALAVKIATTEPPKPTSQVPELPRAIDAWFAKACAREPEGRFQSARELAEALRACFDDLPSLPPLTPSLLDSGSRPDALEATNGLSSSGLPAAVSSELALAPTAALTTSEGGAELVVRQPRAKRQSPRVLAVVAVAGAAAIGVVVGRSSSPGVDDSARAASSSSSSSAVAPPSSGGSRAGGKVVAPPQRIVASSSVAAVDASGEWGASDAGAERTTEPAEGAPVVPVEAIDAVDVVDARTMDAAPGDDDGRLAPVGQSPPSARPTQPPRPGVALPRPSSPASEPSSSARPVGHDDILF